MFVEVGKSRFPSKVTLWFAHDIIYYIPAFLQKLRIDGFYFSIHCKNKPVPCAEVVVRDLEYLKWTTMISVQNLI